MARHLGLGSRKRLLVCLTYPIVSGRKAGTRIPNQARIRKQNSDQRGTTVYFRWLTAFSLPDLA